MFELKPSTKDNLKVAEEQIAQSVYLKNAWQTRDIDNEARMLKEDKMKRKFKRNQKRIITLRGGVGRICGRLILGMLIALHIWRTYIWGGGGRGGGGAYMRGLY